MAGLVPTSQAWTLSGSSDIYKFSGHTVYLDVSSTSCSNSSLTVDDIMNLAVKAADRYWNQVPTSTLRFARGEFSHEPSTGDSASNVSRRARDNAILIGCNSSTTIFGTSGSTLAVAQWIGDDGKIVGASILINDTANTSVDGLGEDQILSTLAHEIGHTFQLGHSEVRESLMYYQIIQDRPKLGQDDYDAVTFLYPTQKNEELKGLFSSCGTIDLSGPDDPGDGPWQFLFSLFVGLIIFTLKRPSKKYI